MPGLLDFLNTPESRMGIGLLAAAGPRADGAGFGQRLNEAMGMQDAYGQNQMRSQLLKSQIDENTSQAAYRKAQADKEQAAQAQLQRMQEALPGLFGQGTPGAPGAQGGSAGTFDVQRAIQLGMPPDLIAKYSGLQNLNRSEVARTIETKDAQGRPVTMQFDKYGQPVGQGMEQWKAPMMVNQGDRTTAIDPATLQARGSFGINMSQSERDASSRGWAGVANARDRLAFDKSKPAEAEKPTWDAVTGSWVYRPSADAPTGRAVPIAGYTKPMNDIQAKAQLFGTRMKEADSILQNLSAAGKEFTTPGANTPLIGPAVNLVDSEKGQQLRQAQRDFLNAVLRRESGAVITDTEFASGTQQYFPQPGDGPAVIAQKARNRALATHAILSEVPSTAAPLQPSQQGQVPKAPMKGQTVNGYKFKGGDPADQNNWEKM